MSESLASQTSALSVSPRRAIATTAKCQSCSPSERFKVARKSLSGSEESVVRLSIKIGEKSRETIGSGVLVDKDLVLSCYHVVAPWQYMVSREDTNINLEVEYFQAIDEPALKNLHRRPLAIFFKLNLLFRTQKICKQCQVNQYFTLVETPTWSCSN